MQRLFRTCTPTYYLTRTLSNPLKIPLGTQWNLVVVYSMAGLVAVVAVVGKVTVDLGHGLQQTTTYCSRSRGLHKVPLIVWCRLQLRIIRFSLK